MNVNFPRVAPRETEQLQREIQALTESRETLLDEFKQVDQDMLDQHQIYTKALKAQNRAVRIRRAAPKVGMGCTMVGLSCSTAGANLLRYSTLAGGVLLAVGLIGMAGIAASIFTIETMKRNDTVGKRTETADREERKLQNLRVEHHRKSRELTTLDSQIAGLREQLAAREKEQEAFEKTVLALHREAGGIQNHETFVDINGHSVDKAVPDH